ncbi:protein kinase [Streptomyces sp. DT2A-34]|uniref:protein kinase domain-containing protein n=1 Tax=Streptomyces sp. DT2A-34 TaxID=3051182 RepID=UPI00265C81DD|nr:protein kinase [Streptomyces sp. DT2A-34]MDO0911261.1 protein kinase [Streptomyces sp. DT2A-34]
MLVADRYRLDTPLGRGAMGEVWRATDEILGRDVAVKVLRTDEAAETDGERFRQEAQTAARLNHPHVVSIYDFGSHDGQLYLVMELVDGWSLAQERSLRGVLKAHETARIGAQMAAGLAAAHRQGVIHRDIKPANVMLTADRAVKIADFGIARFADDAASTLTATGAILGTSAYLAPERALGRPAQPASDMYALGCVLYELLTGQPPFTGATALSVVQQHVDAAPVPPSRLRPEIPGPLDDYIISLLTKDPAQRPTADQAAAWLTNPPEYAPSAPHDERGAVAMPVAPPPANTPRTEGLRPARPRPGKRYGASPRALLAVGGVALFAVSAVVGTALAPGDEGGGSPAPTGTSPARFSSPAVEQPTTAPPSPTATPTTSSATPSYDAERAQKEAEARRKAAEKDRKKDREEEDDD